ncbi:MAG TPA: ATP-binding protein [Gammaproteobacteria bacterium]
MRATIGIKLFLAFLAVAFIVLGVSAGLTRWNFQRGFLNYVDESEAGRLRFFSMRVSQAYEEAGSWGPLRGDSERWLLLMRPPGVEMDVNTGMGHEIDLVGERQIGPGVSDQAVPTAVSRDPLAISPRIAVLDDEGRRLFGPRPAENPQFVEPIVIRGSVVGTLHLNPLEALSNEIDVRFAEQQTRWLYGVSVVALLMAAAAAMLIARQLVAPVRLLTAGTRALTEGRFDERISVSSNDELGQLGRDFNELADTLDRHQSAQRQWIADISHELRTPLAILRGEIQAVEDGVRKADENTMKSLAAETDRLTRLVDDLYELSMSDIGALHYRKQDDDVIQLLRESLDQFAPRFESKGVAFEMRLPNRPVRAHVDGRRITQLFTNVLENSLRYTNEGGTCQVACETSGDELVIEFEDSAPGVPTESLPRLFDRLYRVEHSRGRGSGGAGIGLAICRNIADAHSASLTAEESGLGGLLIRLRLPLSGATVA